MPKFKSILNKILLVTLLASLISASVILAVSIWSETKMIKENLVEKNVKLAEVVSNIIVHAQYTNVWPLEALKKVGESEDIVFWWVVKPNGEIYLANNTDDFGKIINDFPSGDQDTEIKDSFFYKTGEKIKLITHLIKSPVYEKPWIFYLGISEKSVVKAQRDMMLSNFAFFFGIIALVAFIAVLLSKNIVKPIKKLQTAAEKIGRGQFIEVKIDSKDEIGQLATTFNKMVNDLKSSQKALEGARDEAETERNKTVAALTNFPDGLILLDENKKIRFINPEAQKILEISEKQIINKYIGETTSTRLASLLKTFGGDIKIDNEVREFSINEPIKRVFNLKVAPVMHHEDLIGFLIVMIDTTREKEIDAMKSQFVSIAAHQLRTPLTGIKWSFLALLEKETGALNQEQQRVIEGGVSAVNHTIILINDLLNVAHVEEGKFGFIFKPVGLLSVIEEVFKRYQGPAKEKGIQFSLELGKENIPELNIDKEKFALAMDNLIDNAIKYTSPGGKISIKLEKKTDLVKLTVKDSGIGIPKKQIERLFTKFFRGENALLFQTSGSGLGLYIAKNIIERHGGTIEVSSVENKGTTFVISLPLSAKL
ncbi:MAG: HAMP domain-containing protein [Candidatus Portnoybacteria bacterium]|nr:HAMP domain-containing protein [Candidatus Portnoybacteria bacterium]